MVNNLDKLKNLKKVKSFNIEEFDGMKAKIESVEITEPKIVQYKGDEFESCQLIVKTEKLGGTDEKPITASEFIALKKDDESSEFGIPENPNSKAMKFLRFFKVDSFDKVVGKEVMIVKRVTEKGEFLGIHFG